MRKQKILVAALMLILSWPFTLMADDNPFDKGKSVNIKGEWVIKDKTATSSGSDSGDFYHLFFDLRELRFRITGGAEDSEANARIYEQFAVEDVTVDSKRLSVFQWCLVNQQKHSRFLQQGLKVKQDVCNNQGEKGTFTMRLNASSLAAIESGRTLTFRIKPFRSAVEVNFDISDFSAMLASLTAKPKQVQTIETAIAVPEKVVEQQKCTVAPPKDLIGIKVIEYICSDVAAKAKAEASIAALVEKERKHQADLAAENERKRREAEAAKKAEELAAKKAEEARLAAEQAAIAETEAAQNEMNEEITNKMLAVCQKKWAEGEHRCYCEKFIAHAPAGIESDPSCAK
ncbi:MAG: hypothetical protein OEZ15_07160 [Gammaproteobacteria bacterium]|nr:hypothetical protein [Gammaproteobacteria bacterium]